MEEISFGIKIALIVFGLGGALLHTELSSM